jgi:carboxyl-terminal processing protease
MLRYTSRLLGITIFGLALIWFAGPGDADQLTKSNEPVLWADTVHINLQEGKSVQPDSFALSRENFFKNVKLLTNTAFNIRNSYMQDVDVDKMVKAGIEGMLSDLDRFSVLMDKASFDALMETTHGSYEGIGLMIESRDNRVVAMSTIEGTPSYKKGIRPGDIIWSIDGHDTNGMKVADASVLMRGKAGTTVKLVIKRPGGSDLMDFDLERALIALKSVNYSGIVPGTTVGYVRLSRFAEETSNELREAISQLNSQGVTSYIFDLRSNGGGLLSQAKETAELFLKEGSEIVYTRGKTAETERHYKSERPPLVPMDKPLVVLVDEGTASASEIVAGAIQDWDRGLILGNTTFGKGLVQEIYQITNDGSMALKLTTAKYYVPSGRCIQSPERQSKHPNANLDDDSANVSDSLKITDREVFHTLVSGRPVYGGGGIVPDIDLDRETWKPVEINLERKSMFFDFAVDYITKHPDIKPDFQVTDQTVSDFKQYLRDKKFTYKSTLQVAMENMEKTITLEGKDSLFKPQLDNISSLIEKEKDADLDKSIDYIKRSIKREIVSSIAGERGVYEQIVLKTDKAVQKALSIIQQPKEYSRLITEGQTPTLAKRTKS